MSAWQLWVQLSVNGLAVGAIYALVALGLVLTYKATEVLNFAHGDLVAVSAFAAWGLISVLGWPFAWAVLATVLGAAALGYGIDALVVRRIAGQPQFAGVMLTIAIAFMLRGLISIFFGPQSRTFATPWSGLSRHWGNVAIADLQLVIMGLVLLVTATLLLFFKYNRFGIAMQAASQNQLAAYLNGIGVKRLTSWVWALGGATAAFAGILLAPTTMVDTSLWFVVLKAMAALVLGGFGSVAGAIVGGLLIGLIEQFAGVFLPDGSKDIAAYVVLIGVLVIRPHGLLGEAHGKRV